MQGFSVDPCDLTERLAGAHSDARPGRGDADWCRQARELAGRSEDGKLPKSDSFDHGHHLWCWAFC